MFFYMFEGKKHSNKKDSGEESEGEDYEEGSQSPVAKG